MANKVEVSDDEDRAESVEWYVCGRADSTKQVFPDDLYDFCSKCGAKVRHRPHGPVAPKKICVECAMPSIIKDEKAGDLHIVTTSKVIQEVRTILKRDPDTGKKSN